MVRETIGSGTTAKVLDFIYDASGKPFALTYTNGTATPVTYYYVLNIQGDVIALMTASREIVARYTYNAWGKLLSVTDEDGNAITSASHIANLNPIRYRGYYYDTETGFYYLQSRYYDPVMHRFINADAAEYSAMSAYTLNGASLFTYCGNNPVMNIDESGHWFLSKIIKATVSGVINAACTAITGGSAAEIAKSFAQGAVEELISGISIIDDLIDVYHAVKTVVDCRQAGASWGASLLAGGVNYTASYVNINTADEVANGFFNYTFGTSAALISEAVTVGVQQSAGEDNIPQMCPSNDAVSGGSSALSLIGRGGNHMTTQYSVLN